MTTHKEEHLVFLDELRESGQTNMFGAAPYLADEFGLLRAEAQSVLKHWMQTFEARHRDD